MERGGSKKYERRDRRRRKFSESETLSSGTEIGSSLMETSSSGTEVEASGSHRCVRRKDEKGEQKFVKVKVEDDESKRFMKSVQESLEAIKVNLADNRKPRRVIPTTRTNVWCAR